MRAGRDEISPTSKATCGELDVKREVIIELGRRARIILGKRELEFRVRHKDSRGAARCCPLEVQRAGSVGPQDAGDSGFSTMGTGPVPYLVECSKPVSRPAS